MIDTTICAKRGESNHSQMGLGNPLLDYGLIEKVG